MGVFEARGQLGKSFKELQQRWGEVRLAWGDAVADQFEKKYLNPVEMDLRSAVGAMEQLSILLQQLRRDCQ